MRIVERDIYFKGITGRGRRQYLLRIVIDL
jgi:hypothetical protein